MSTKVSVVVPAYNIAEYLPRCLDSILNQTHSNLEVIVVSDGSTDNTNEIIRDYAEKDSRIVPIFKENTGVSETRRVGIEKATGEWFGFVDGDDYIEPEMYERLLNNAVKYNAEISHCGYQIVYPSRVDYYYNTGRLVQQDNLTGVKDLLEGSFIEPGLCIKLYRKNLISKLFNGDVMDWSIRYNEDVLMNYYLFSYSDQSVFEDVCPYHYILRKNSAATSKISEKKLFDPIEVRKTIFGCSSDMSNAIQSIAYKNYLYCGIHMFRSISQNSYLKVYKTKANEYKQDIKKIDASNFALSKRSKIERLLFLHMTSVQMLIYKFYDRFLSKNKDKYEVK